MRITIFMFLELSVIYFVYYAFHLRLRLIPYFALYLFLETAKVFRLNPSKAFFWHESFEHLPLYRSFVDYASRGSFEDYPPYWFFEDYPSHIDPSHRLFKNYLSHIDPSHGSFKEYLLSYRSFAKFLQWLLISSISFHDSSIYGWAFVFFQPRLLRSPTMN